MAFDGPREVVASAARTATGNSGTLTLLSQARNLNLLYDVTANSGTGQTLTFSVEWSQDGGTTWAVADTADDFAATGANNFKRVKRFDVKAPSYRVVWTIAGATPSYTFSIREYLT